MVKIYVTPTCSSCRKAKKWLEEHNVKYKEINLLTTKLTDEDINLIYTDGALENIYFSRIDKSDYPFCVKRRYYQFFHNLFDNLGRNIVYVGDSMKDGVPLDEIQEVEESFIDSDHRIIAKRNNMSEEELNNLNSDIRRKVLERH